MYSWFLAFLCSYLSLIGGAERNGGLILFTGLAAGLASGLIAGASAIVLPGPIGAGGIVGLTNGVALGTGAGAGAIALPGPIGADGVVGRCMLCTNF